MEAKPNVPGYRVVRYLSSGGEGRIWIVVKESSSKAEQENLEVVCKRRTCCGIGEANEAIQECLAMTRVSGRHNVAILDAFLSREETDSDLFYCNIIMEYCQNGDLSSYLFGAPEPRVVTFQEALEFTHDIADGLAAIHKMSFVHLDLKPENIFLTESHRLKIGDLGLAQSLNNDKSGKIEGVAGTSVYMAPEVFARQGAHEKADVWALGVIMYEMFHGESLARQRRSFGLEAHGQKDQWHAEILFSHSTLTVFGKLAELAVAMLHVDPLQRPSIADCLKVTTALQISDRSIPALGLESSDMSAGDGHVSFRPLRKGEEKEASRVLAEAYMYDPRFYYYTYAVDEETRRKITLKLMEAVLTGAAGQKAVWVAVCNSRIVGAMIVMPPDDKKRPPISTLFTSGWKLIKHTKLLLPGMKLYSTAMKEVDRVFPNQNREWFVINLGILPAFQSCGIGESFLGMVSKWSNEQGTRILSLVFHHRQVAFLEKMGFKVISQVDTEKQPSFYTLVRDPATSGQIQLSARTSIQIDGMGAKGGSRGSITIRPMEMAEKSNPEDKGEDFVDL